MMVAGTSFNFLPFGQPRVVPAIEWVQDAAGYWNGSDRGASQDVFEAKVTFAGLDATLDSLQSVLQANREGVTLSSFTTTGQEIFGPEIDYTGSISATVVEIEPRSHHTLNKVSEVGVTFRAISPTKRGTTASLATLRLQEAWEGDQDWTATKAFAYGQTAYYADHRGDVGRIQATYQQKPAEARAIMAYLLSTARANAVTLPTFPGITYPFGQPRGSGPFSAKVRSWEVTRKDLNRWIFKIEWVEA